MNKRDLKTTMQLNGGANGISVEGNLSLALSLFKAKVKAIGNVSQSKKRTYFTPKSVDRNEKNQWIKYQNKKTE